MEYYVYILECADGSYYIGSTNDIEKRLHSHNHLKSGARYTKIRRPVTMKYHEVVDGRGAALRREAELKKLTRQQKELLMKNTHSHNHAQAVQTFSDRVVKLALMVPAGHVTTYGMIARAAGGGSMASRSVTGILGKAYQTGQKDIPFHRIVYADGKVWFDSQYEAKRRALYKKEGIQLDKNNRIVDFYDKLFEFK